MLKTNVKINELMFIWTSSYLVIVGIHDTYISTYYLPEGKKRRYNIIQKYHVPTVYSVSIGYMIQ